MTKSYIYVPFVTNHFLTCNTESGELTFTNEPFYSNDLTSVFTEDELNTITNEFKSVKEFVRPVDKNFLAFYNLEFERTH